MYDERYYAEREADLKADFDESKEKAFAKLVGTVKEWEAEAGKIQLKFKELTEKKTKAIEQDKKAADETKVIKEPKKETSPEETKK